MTTIVYVIKVPYTYVYGDHEGNHKKAKVPFGIALEAVGDKPYDSAWKVTGVPAEYCAGYDHTGYPEWWIAAADVSPELPIEPEEPEPLPGTELPGSLELAVAVLRAAGIKSITLE